eukprot:TRINITY_DN3666_c0_g1_i1.p1 TRINITY_DN3666_c0_g1~~TRINITY_DN3666_c0_g1_i1.p1  ORF type:complete len:267 (-),score=50.19 TRINITY_DN3666_c0_g1_i1:107-907(-)
MAQCVGQYWLQASLRQHLMPHFSGSKMNTLSGMPLPSFLSRATCWEAMMLARFHPEIAGGDGSRVIFGYPSVICFRDDDSPFPDHLLDKDYSDLSVRASLEIRYSPWAVEFMSGAAKMGSGKMKESTGGPSGGGKNGDGDGGGDGGGGGGDDDGEDHIFLLPVLTLAFAAFHLGYCIAIWVKDDQLDFNFFKTGLGLFGLLTIAALRLNARTGIDAYILGLGASVGVMVWTGERCLVKREGNPAGIVALFAASMSVMFTAALYHNI